MPGLVDLQVEKQVLIPQLKVTPDYERAALYGITPAAITEALEALSNGRVVSQIVEGNRRFDVVMRLSDENRSTTGLQDLLVSTPQGFVPLRLLATVEESDGPNEIQRENGQRRIVVRANGDGQRDMAATVADVRRTVAEMALPSGYTTRLEGTFRAQEEAAFVIGALSLVSLTLIFLVLYQRYQSAALAAIILTNIPLALIGSVVALLLAGQPLSVASMIGFITLAGIAARNGILKISHYINLALFEGEKLRSGARHTRQPGAADAGADDGAVRRLWRWCRCCSVPASRVGRSCIRSRSRSSAGLISSTLLDTLLTPVLFLKFGGKPLERIRASRKRPQITRSPAPPRSSEIILTSNRRRTSCCANLDF